MTKTSKTPDQAEIEKHAYRLYEERGREEGHHEADWHAAVQALSDEAEADEEPAATAAAKPRSDGKSTDKPKQQPRA